MIDSNPLIFSGENQMTARPTTLVALYSHGKTEFDKLDVVYGGNSDPRLTQEGVTLARKLGDFLKNYFPNAEAHYSSDLQRATQTAALALGEKETIVPLNAFREMHYGELDGILRSGTRNEYWRNFIKKEPPHQKIDPLFKWKTTPFAQDKAEPLMEVWKRVSEQLIKLSAQHACSIEMKAITVCCHESVIQTLIMAAELAAGVLEKNWCGLYPLPFEKEPLPEGTIAIFKIATSFDEEAPLELISLFAPSDEGMADDTETFF